MSDTFFFKNVKNNSTKKTKQTVEQEVKDTNSLDYERKMEKRLEQCLSNVEGVGEVKIMITIENGNEIVVAKDTVSETSNNTENDNSNIKRQSNSIKNEDKTIIIEDKPLIIKEIEPKIAGVIVVAQGGNNPEVKNSIINATQAVLNVEAHKIQVLKMK